MASPDPQNTDQGLQEQPFLSHIMELKDRVTHMVIGVLIPFIVFAIYANELTTFIAQPVLTNLAVPGGEATAGTVQTIKPLGAFLTPLKVALIAAIITALPWILYQAWSFVAPALYKHEKRFVLPLLISSGLLYYIGMAFAFFVVLPLVFGFLVQVGPDWLNVAPDISEYVDFVLTVFLAFAIAFQVPIATILLIGTGMVEIKTLKEKRPYVVVGAFVVGMFLTPPDIISQTLLAVPMWILFELGIFFSTWFFPNAGKQDPEDDPEPSIQPPGGGNAAAAAATSTAATAAAASSDSNASGNASTELSPDDLEYYRPMTEEEMDREMNDIEEWEEGDVEAENEKIEDSPKEEREKEESDASAESGDTESAQDTSKEPAEREKYPWEEEGYEYKDPDGEYDPQTGEKKKKAWEHDDWNEP